MVDLVVVYSPVGGGHRSAAVAVAEAAEARGDRVALVDAFAYAPRVFGDAYLAAHLAGQTSLRGLYGSAYEAANHRGGPLDPLRRGIDHVAFRPLVEHVLSLSPRAVVGTHHLPLVALGRARRKGWLAAPLVGVVTDYTAHACWAEKGVDAFAVPCARARHELMLHGVEPPKITVTGLPVRATFERVRALRAPGDGEPLRVLVTGGGFGVGPIGRIVRSFVGVESVELVVVCGRSEHLARRATQMTRRAGVRARVIGLERDMAARMGEAHVVVGKAGGLTISEAMTAGRPLAIVAATPGNEAENETYVVDGGAAIACAASRVGRAIEELRAARMLEAMGARGRDLVPRASAARVLEVADGLVGRRSLSDAA